MEKLTEFSIKPYQPNINKKIKQKKNNPFIIFNINNNIYSINN